MFNEEVKHTCRGLRFYEFEDLNNKKCTIQKSSIATEHAILLGISEEVRNTMHLTQGQARELGKMLIHFADSGELPIISGII